MPTTQESLAGEYELLHDEFTRPEDADPAKRGSYKRPKTGDPDAHVMVTYSRGDLVSLSDEEARRLTAGPRPAVGKPGAAEEALIATLDAQLELLKARREQIAAQQKAIKAQATDPALDPRFQTPRPGFVAQTGDVEPLPPGVSPLQAGNEDSQVPPSAQERQAAGDDTATGGGPAQVVQRQQALSAPTAADPSGPLTRRTAEDMAKAAKEAATAARTGSTSSPSPPPPADEKPAKNASTAVWVAYATSHGMTEDEAKGKSRDQLAEHFSK